MGNTLGGLITVSLKKNKEVDRVITHNYPWEEFIKS